MNISVRINKLFKLLCVLACGLFQYNALADEGEAYFQADMSFDSIAKDYRAFYSSDRLSRLGIGFAAVSVIANTNIDNDVQTRYQNDVRSASTDDIAKFAKIFGEGKIFIPFSLLTASLTYLDTDSALGNWGVNTFRAFAVGGPAMLLMQRATGGSRPDEESYNSEWRPFADSNGVSGHAFMGSIPFLTIARMNPDSELIKYTAYGASILTAWSRVNDNKHYLSQIMLGWYMGWESVNSVFETNKKPQTLSISPYVFQDGYGLAMSIKW